MLPQQLLRPGQKVILEIESADKKGQYSSYIADVSPENVTLGAPMKGTDYFPLPLDETISVYIFSSRKVYRFEGKVLENRNGFLPTIVITYPKSLTHVQRRHFVRVRLLYDLKVSPIDNGDKKPDKPIYLTGIDISAGGIGARYDDRSFFPRLPFSLGQKIGLHVNLPASENKSNQFLSFETEGEVVHFARERQGFRVGIRFTEIDRKLQESIISWCFAFQRRLIQQGLLNAWEG